MPSETRQQILEACERLIQSKGLTRVTTKEIARETGLSEGALYRHFDHKEDLFLAVFERLVRVLTRNLSPYVAGQGYVEDNLREMALVILRYYEQLIPLAASFFADTELLRRIREVLQGIGGTGRLHEWIARYIEEEQRLGRISSDLPALSISITLIGPLFQYAFLRQLTGEDQFHLNDQQFVENLVQVLGPGLLRSGAGGDFSFRSK